MDFNLLQKHSEFEWHIEPHGLMRVPAILYASRDLVEAMDPKVYEQISNVAALPGIVKAAYAMPDAHWGYGFPIGGVAAFDPEAGGIVSAGGVGFDISCGVRVVRSTLKTSDIEPVKADLADALYEAIPAGVGSRSDLELDDLDMDEMLTGGAKWAVEYGYGDSRDLDRIEEHGCMAGAAPGEVSPRAKERQRPEMGTLGSGNHYLEVQRVSQIFDAQTAHALGFEQDQIVVSIHCGSRGLGHQIGTDFLRRMANEAIRAGIELPDRELACAPLSSQVGISYLGAMRAATNCALANREILTHFLRRTFARYFPNTPLTLVYDVSHNTCKEEWHEIDGEPRRLFVHRKGATRAFGPGHPELPDDLKAIGQPVFIGGSMGTGSYVLVGAASAGERSFFSACHGAGRSMSRHQASKTHHGKDLIQSLANRGILIRSGSFRGVAEEAPDAYKDVDKVVDAADAAGLTKKVARLSPLICIKG